MKKLASWRGSKARALSELLEVHDLSPSRDNDYLKISQLHLSHFHFSLISSWSHRLTIWTAWKSLYGKSGKEITVKREIPSVAHLVKMEKREETLVNDYATTLKRSSGILFSS